MRMKTYRAKTFKGALEQIKSEWGPEAFVLSSKQVKSPGISGVLGRRVFEVTAGLEGVGEPAGAVRKEPPVSAPAATTPAPRAIKRPDEVAREYASLLTPQPSVPSSQERRELADLRRWIYGLTRLSQPPDVFLMAEPLGEIYESLCANDLDPAIAKMLMNSACTQFPAAAPAQTAEIEAFVGSLVEKLVTVKATTRKIKIFVGPTGVGKTTTAAKLAARALVNREGKVGLITMDTFRIGGAQQLRTFAEIMSIPVKVAKSVAEMDRVLGEWKSFDTILIDTVGKSQRQLEEFADLAAYLKGREDIEKHLIVSATTKPLDLREIVDKFEIFFPDFICFTKLDETTTYGPILNEHNRTGKPLSYFGVGQRVPEDLELATKKRVSELIMGGGM